MQRQLYDTNMYIKLSVEAMEILIVKKKNIILLMWLIGLKL